MSPNFPEPHRAIEVSKDHWVWPTNVDSYLVNGVEMFCADVFRATGTTFVRMVQLRHRREYESRSYVPSSYFTAMEWSEIDQQ